MFQLIDQFGQLFLYEGIRGFADSFKETGSFNACVNDSVVFTPVIQMDLLAKNIQIMFGINFCHRKNLLFLPVTGHIRAA